MKEERRFDLLLGGLESELSRQFARYREALQKNAPLLPRSWGEECDGPYWNQLPRWLSAGCRGCARPARFLDEVLWAQTCLFYAVRIQDDVLDGTVSRSALMLAPLLFLSESERSFATIIGGRSNFWIHYRWALSSTTAAVARVARLQRDPRSPAADLLDAYGDVDAIFTVGAAAVCDRTSGRGVIGRVNRLVSELGKVLLALDDLDDVEEDLADGRVNYAARMILPRLPSEPRKIAEVAPTWHGRSSREGYALLRRTLEECLRQASEAVAPLKLEPVSMLIEETRSSVERIGA